MARQSGQGSVQIIVALIGVAGVMAAALFGNWDKIFQERKVGAAEANHAGPVADAWSAGSVNSGKSDTSRNDSPSAENGGVSEGAAVPSIAGPWYDSDGFTYLFQQQSGAFNYVMMQRGNQTGTGRGRIEGRKLTYSYSGGGDEGSCQAEIAAENRVISGRCTDVDSGASWAFQIHR